MSLLIPGTNSIKDTGYDVANSLRFNDGSNDYLSISGITPTNSKKFTYSFWVKRTVFNTDQAMLSYESDSNNRGGIELQTGELFRYFERVGGSTVIFVEISSLFTDPSAWYNIIVATDTTQSTESDRVKIYVNGVLQTSFATSVIYPSQNSDTRANGSTAKNIGRRNVNNDYYFDGYLAEVVFIDGSQLDQTSFGEFDSDSPRIWKPKDVSGLTFGNAGFHLDFENSSSLGADVSGNSNNFTANNLTSIDQCTDTCTNNFNILNPIHPTASNFTISEAATKISKTGSSHNKGGYLGTLMPTTSGKWYFEAKIDEAADGDGGRVGIANYDSITGTDTMQTMSNASGLEVSTKGAVLFVTVNGTTTENTSSGTFSDGDIIQFAMDLDNKAIYVGRNGTYLTLTGSSGGDPTSGSSKTGAIVTDTSYILNGGPMCSYFGSYVGGVNDTTTVSFNFGNPAYALSSGNADGNGFGNFEYAPPTGYLAWCTKNLGDS